MSFPPHKSLRRVALLHPFELPIVVCILLVAVVFAVFPEALEHSPISFEERGLVHHLFHYSLLIGSVLAFSGLFFCDDDRSRKMLIAGYALLVTAITMNLSAIVIDEILGTATENLSGLTVAYRSAIVIGFCIRIWTVLAQPVITVKARRDDA